MNTRQTLAIIIILSLISAVCCIATASSRTTAVPDFEKIKSETLNPKSEYYYPRLMEAYLSNDTTMTGDQYHYLYYGTVFQEDYNPYRPDPFAAEIKAAEPLYNKNEALSRSEKEQIRNVAVKALSNNPFNIKQLTYLVYAYEQAGKQNLAKIWKHKLNNILLTISRSGTGADSENAIVIVDPMHEFDYFNIAGSTVEKQTFEEPYYEHITVKAPKAKNTKEYWFDLHQILEQYYKKHPSEL